MGNCVQCVQQQTERRSNINSSDNLSRSTNRNILANPFRTSNPHNLNSLIDETLLIIRTVVDTDQEPPHAMLIVSRIANREDRWIDVMIALVDRVPIEDPLGATVIALLLDECSLPSKELVQQLIRRLCHDNRTRVKYLKLSLDLFLEKEKQRSVDFNQQVMSTSILEQNRSTKSTSSSLQEEHLHSERNTLVLLACLAEKLVGSTSASMLNSMTLEFIVDRVCLGIHKYDELSDDNFDTNNVSLPFSSIFKVILFALIAVEKFSQTPESKLILMKSLAIEKESTKTNVLEYYEAWATSKNCLKRQIGFYAQWLLDNVFILNYRRPSYERINHQSINVMLNDKDVSEYLKIGPDGLEARSDMVSFESVRCTFQVTEGVWYYEVFIITDGVMQIGWATKQSKFMNYEGYGIGDDIHSVAYDGCRNLIWYGAKSFPHNQPSWKPGDILGCLIDLDRREIVFSLNGHWLEPFRKIFSSNSTSINEGFFPAASFMSYQHCRFNFGAEPFLYPPSTVKSFKTFNEYGQLTDEEKLILPKYKKLELLRSMKISDQDCIICVDDTASITLKPCQHNGFCEKCAARLEICPICRTEIQEKAVTP